MEQTGSGLRLVSKRQPKIYSHGQLSCCRGLPFKELKAVSLCDTFWGARSNAIKLVMRNPVGGDGWHLLWSVPFTVLRRRTAETLCSAAKNVILAGVRSVTIHDTAKVSLQDLSAQFYLGEQVGAQRVWPVRQFAPPPL